MHELKQKLFKLKPTQIIVIGFLSVILLGTFLLMLPISSSDGEVVSFTDAIFTATSSVCVTGLVVVNTMNHWTVFGKIVIISLIQIGGIGFMSLFTIILLFLGKKITLKERVILQESFNLSNFQGMVTFVKKIVKGTFILEGAGAIILSLRFIPEFGILGGIFRGIFHSVSAFCNAGFDILTESSLIPYAGDYIINIVIMFLIVVGGLGFTVWTDLLNLYRKRNDKNFNLKKGILDLSLHSKIVISITFFLIIFGWMFFLISEFNNTNTIGNLRFDQKILASLFQSVTLRTAGFDSINQAGMNYASKFMSILLMAVGGSPGGTAGGIKTVTMGVIMISVLSVIKGSDSINIFKKSISFNTLQKSLAVAIMILSVIFVSTMILSISEAHMEYDYEFIDLLFETTSAIATVGLSTGITSSLSIVGKLVIIVCMFIGRLGPITVAVALSSKYSQNQNLVHYPEDKVLVG